MSTALSGMAQSDWALHSTYTSHKAAVYEIRLEVPREQLMVRLEQSLAQMRDFQAYYANIISGITHNQVNPSLLERQLSQMENHLSMIKKRLVDNSPEKGAGFAVDEHHIVTLSTLVSDATSSGSRLVVRDEYNNMYPARLKGVDHVTGVAVLEVNDATMTSTVNLDHRVEDLPEASFLMTIQRPYDLLPTPFGGMVGGYDVLLGFFDFERYIQTSLPLYPNNQGAPVFNPSGHFIGMMVHAHSVGSGPQITFVMPANIIADSARAIIASGKRERGYLPGLQFEQHPLGVLVTGVRENSAADEAGLQVNDLIIGVDGQREQRALDFYHRIISTDPEDYVRLDVMRGNSQIHLDVKTSAKRQ